MQTQATKFILHASVFSNLILSFILIVKLPVLTVDVTAKVLELSTQLTMAQQSVEASVQGIQNDLCAISDRVQANSDRIEAMCTAAPDAPTANVSRSEIKRWADRARQMNPDNIPESIGAEEPPKL